jgi:hypothetical protein
MPASSPPAELHPQVRGVSSQRDHPGTGGAVLSGYPDYGPSPQSPPISGSAKPTCGGSTYLKTVWVNSVDADSWNYWSTDLFRILEVDPRQGPLSLELMQHRVHPEDRQQVVDRYRKALNNWWSAGLANSRASAYDGERFSMCLTSSRLLKSLWTPGIGIQNHLFGQLPWIQSWRNCYGAGKPSKTSSRDAPLPRSRKRRKNNSSHLGDTTLGTRESLQVDSNSVYFSGWRSKVCLHPAQQK